MSGLLKVLDLMGAYISQLEQERAMQEKQIEQLKAQLQAATKAEA